ncbi:N-acetylmuramoyl-L-alanine amidase [Minwuia sp.]|uniref:N-acetylmuramoyl-L-alanine amidase n=1 Tax=Minwuia sp. TaxID=2493630 RepID=UPI003A8E53CC
MIRLFVFVLSAFLLAQSAMAAGQIQGVRTGEHVGLTRIVVDLTEKPDWNLFVLDDPYRVVIDIEEAVWKLQAQPDPPRGLVSNLRYGRFAADTGRLVLELKSPALAARQFVLPPQAGQGYRLVVDLRSADDTEFTRARTAAIAKLTKPPVAAAPAITRFGAGVPPLPPPRPGRIYTVVIDPGHGGVDPGALGRGRTREKDIVLAVGKKLRDAMKATGRYRVVMTRDRDVFVKLRERVRIARRARADLFISLHADAAAGRSVRGAGIYTLSETASDKEAAALARRENQSDILAGVDLTQSADEVTSLILIDLVQRETMNDSARFARVAVDQIGKTIRLRRNPHRFAGFRVLRAPDVPSVLVELGFVSNAEEERKLKSPEWQRRVAAALVEAVDSYFRTRK